MNTREQSDLIMYWWDKLRPLRRKFVRQTILGGLEQEDLEQECFIQLTRALERYRADMGVPFESYYKIVLHGWRANQNRVKARKELAFGEEEMSLVVDERVNVEQDVENQLLMEEVFEAISQLEEEERGIIEAYYLQRKKLAELASEWNVSYKAIEFKKQKALFKLRGILSR